MGGAIGSAVEGWAAWAGAMTMLGGDVFGFGARAAQLGLPGGSQSSIRCVMPSQMVSSRSIDCLKG